MVRDDGRVLREEIVLPGRVSPPEDAGGAFFNRDLSWLEFNRRVLHLATRADTPTLERARFMAIFANNLDEFFMKRIGLLKRLAAERSLAASHDGLPIGEQLRCIRELVLELSGEQARAWEQGVRPALEEAGIRIERYAELASEDRTRIDEWYRRSLFPVLTPLAFDPGHRFPFISNLSTSLGVLVSHPGERDLHFARVKIPTVFPPLVPVADPAGDTIGHERFVFLDDVIAANLQDLFPGMQINDVTLFRVTRSAAVEIEDQEVVDLLEHVEQELRMRRFASAVRLEVPEDAGEQTVELLRRELDLDEADVYRTRGPIDFTDLFTLAEINRPDLRYPRWAPVSPAAFEDGAGDLFAQIRERDVLVHHPYESFRNSVERFVAAAARDRDVLAIKLTLYRTSPGSAFISSLVRAAESGKQVAVLVELRARFDEHRNVRFARQLEKAGVHVAYGVVGLKTHCKSALVVRQESGGIRCYAHLGTGNYHPRTAQLYTDLGLFTADPGITDDLVQLFNYMTGRSDQQDYNELIVAPRHMRQKFVELIDAEIGHARAGRPARIWAKMNALEDRAITEKLYEASGEGVDISLVVRGFCCLRPGAKGMSENIRVSSIVGRFLEHSRCYHFSAGRADPAEGHWFIASADWMYRNLNRRVEVAAPVKDPQARQRLAHLRDVIERDHARAWDLQPDGRYVPRTPPPGADAESSETLGTFEALMRETRARSVH